MTSDFIETVIGYYKQTDHALIFFGNKKSSIQNVKTQFPNLIFKNIKQTHSDICVKANDIPVEADAHWTIKKQEALVIKTADCIPLFLVSENIALAIHAGWRGVANLITKKAIAQTQIENYIAYIGPHIFQESFETQQDCYNIFKELNFHNENYVIKKNCRYYIDLKSYIKPQTEDAKFIFDVDLNTFTSNSFHSYRRDKQNAGRNISFCALL